MMILRRIAQFLKNGFAKQIFFIKKTVWHSKSMAYYIDLNQWSLIFQSEIKPEGFLWVRKDNMTRTNHKHNEDFLKSLL